MPSINDLIKDQRSPLAGIFKQVEAMRHLTQKFNELLPEEFKQQCQVVNFRNGVLVVSVKQQAMISRFHYLKADLLETLKATEFFCFVKDLKIIV